MSSRPHLPLKVVIMTRKEKKKKRNRSRKRGKLTLVINAAVPQVSFDNEKENTALVKRGTPGGTCDLDLFT